MPTEPRSIPIATPRLPGRIVEGFRAAIADPKQRPKAYIRLTASGGVHGESYNFEFRIDTAGRISAHLVDELKQRRYTTPADTAKTATPARFVAVARKLEVEALARVENPSAGFPPDSVIGRLEISDGEQSATFLFLADDQQAMRARHAAPDALRKAVDVLYREAEAHLGAEDLKP
jgi:plasmid stabilization system protein ParE